MTSKNIIIIGSTGCGKTTLIDLLSGNYGSEKENGSLNSKCNTEHILKKLEPLIVRIDECKTPYEMFINDRSILYKQFINENANLINSLVFREYNFIPDDYSVNIACIILMYDITDPESRRFASSCLKQLHKKIPIIMIGNKDDLNDKLDSEIIQDDGDENILEFKHEGNVHHMIITVTCDGIIAGKFILDNIIDLKI